MDPELAWQDLVAAALLGTERRAFAPPTTTGPLGVLLAGLAGREPEKALLGTAAALAPFRRLGRRPTSDDLAPTEPAETDDRPRCSVASDGHLALMLAGTNDEVLPEWLAALNSVGKRPPEESVPDLLDLGRAKPDLRPAIVDAIGPLGAWLARQNPDWDYASGVESPIVEDEAAAEALWQAGTTQERTSLLGRLRESSPDRARALVASTWSTDGPELRAAFLAGFAAGLTEADEPFLEAALDDRRKEVRAAAAGLLVRLPGSGLVGRMIERVTPLLKLTDRPPLEVDAAVSKILTGEPGEETWRGLADLKEGKLKPPRPTKHDPDAVFLEVTLPKACDKAMIRDGIEPKSPMSGLGEKTWWLWQMVSRIPPSHWSQTWRRTSEDLTEAVVRSEAKEAIYTALVEAAIRFGESEWVDALLPHRGKITKYFSIFAHFASLPEATTLKLILEKDATARSSPTNRPLTDEQMSLLHRTVGPWGNELSRLFLERLTRNLGHKGHFDYNTAGVLSTAARCLPPALVLASPPTRTVADSGASAYVVQHIDRQLEAFHALIQFRHDMIQELRR